MRMGAEIQYPEQRLEVASQYLESLSTKIGPPFRILDASNVRGFRYAKPNVVHFFVLHMAKSISHVNAMLTLYHHGQLYECLAVGRIYYENKARTEFVLAGVKGLTLSPKVSSYLSKYFSDHDIHAQKRPSLGLKQKEMHDGVSEGITEALAFLKSLGIDDGLDNTDHKSSLLLSDLYQFFSNYVHGRYPESMSLYDPLDARIRPLGGVTDEDTDLHFDFFSELAGDVEKTFAKGCFKLWPQYQSLFGNDVMSYSAKIAGTRWSSSIKTQNNADV